MVTVLLEMQIFKFTMLWVMHSCALLPIERARTLAWVDFHTGEIDDLYQHGGHENANCS